MGRTAGRRWTPSEDNRLREMADAHRPYGEMAAVLGRTVSAVRSRCETIGCSLLRANGMSMAALGRLLGVEDKTVAWWCRKRWLRSSVVGRATGRGWVRLIEYDDLLAFLEDERYWDLWRPERITDVALREWATEVRGHVVYLSTTEAARLLHCHPTYVNRLLHQGVIRGVKHAQAWAIRVDWLPPSLPEEGGQRPKGAKLTEREAAYIARWWGRRPAVWIAKRLGRSDQAVGKHARRLGLPGLGRGCWKQRQRGRGR